MSYYDLCISAQNSILSMIRIDNNKLKDRLTFSIEDAKRIQRLHKMSDVDKVNSFIAGSNIEPDCDNCKHRFQCYTMEFA
jgi:hypothetical protein